MFVPTTLDERLIALPEVQACKGVLQGPFHPDDVFNHQLAVVAWLKQFTQNQDIIAAGYLHDTGKPIVKKPLYRENGELWLRDKDSGEPYYTFPGHEKLGEGIVLSLDSKLFTELGLNQFRISTLVGAHYLPMQFIKQMREQTSYALFEHQFNLLVSRLYHLEQATEMEGTKVSCSDIITMFKADKLAQGRACTDKAELFMILSALSDPDHRETSLREIYVIQQDSYHQKDVIPSALVTKDGD